MDWSKVKQVPKYNPMMFTLCRHLDGSAKWEFAKRAGLTTKRLSDIENGISEATDEEVKKITACQTHVIETFFEQWHEYETKFLPYGGIPVQINYYKFKIFRDANPPQLSVV